MLAYLDSSECEWNFGKKMVSSKFHLFAKCNITISWGEWWTRVIPYHSPEFKS